MSEPHVLGVDLSLRSTGVASSLGWCQLVEGPGLPRKGATIQARAQRIYLMRHHVIEVVKVPDLVVLEGPAFAAADPSAFDRAALWHFIYRWLTVREIPTAIAPPSSLKKYATGNGNAKKGAVADAVTRRWPDYDHGGDDNLADSVALMAMGRDRLGCPLAPMPQTHRIGLNGCDWPEIRDEGER